MRRAMCTAHAHGMLVRAAHSEQQACGTADRQAGRRAHPNASFSRVSVAKRGVPAPERSASDVCADLSSWRAAWAPSTGFDTVAPARFVGPARGALASGGITSSPAYPDILRRCAAV